MRTTRRWAAAALLGAAVAMGAAAPAAAHGPVSHVSVAASAEATRVTVRATVSYLDGDPNAGAVLEAAATSGTRTVPVTMEPGGDPGEYVGHADLPTGSWEITVASVGESTGTGRAELVVPRAVDGAASVLPGTGALTGGAALALLVVGLAALALRRVGRTA